MDDELSDHSNDQQTSPVPAKEAHIEDNFTTFRNTNPLIELESPRNVNLPSAAFPDYDEEPQEHYESTKE